VLAGRAAARGVSLDVAGPAARGVAFAVVLLAVFVPLLASADHEAPERPVGVAVASLGGALAYVRLCPPKIAPRPPQRLLGTLEWAVALGALVALFAAFVALQLTTLFGGNQHVLETAGLTYSQYARSGFWQLLAVAALTFAVIAAAQRWAGQRGRLLTGLLAALCLLTLVVLASALKRLDLLEAELGFTRVRFAAHAALLWLAALFVLVLAARFAASWLPRAIVAVTAVTFLAFALSDPERRIADANVERYERTGEIDMDYLLRLGPDAAPAVAKVTQPPPVQSSGLVGFNLARQAAARRTRTAR